MNFWKENTNLFRELFERVTFSVTIQTNTFSPSSKYFLTLIERNPSSHFTPFRLKGLFSVSQGPDSALHKIRDKTLICSNRSTRQTWIHYILSLSTESQNPAPSPLPGRLVLHCLDRQLRDRGFQNNEIFYRLWLYLWESKVTKWKLSCATPGLPSVNGSSTWLWY